jgi:hypothetical protein
MGCKKERKEVTEKHLSAWDTKCSKAHAFFYKKEDKLK